MLTEVKNQIKVMFLSLKYNIMKQMINKVTFIIDDLVKNISGDLKDNIGGYTINQVVLLWGLASSTYRRISYIVQ